MYNFARTLILKKKLTSFDQLLIFLKGMFLGMAIFIPGVGMATFSLVLNIYDEFISILHNLSLVIRQIFNLVINKFDYKVFKKSLSNLVSDFNIPFFIGFIIGFACISFVVLFVLENAPAYARALFFGTVLASTLSILPFVKQNNPKEKLITIFSALLFFYLFGLHSVNIFYAPSWVTIAITGLLSSLTFVLPGFGGSSILIIFNTYHHFVNILNDLLFYKLNTSQIIDLSIFTVTFIIGFVFTIALIKFILKKYNTIFMAFLSGIMLASLRLLYPFITMKGDLFITVKPFDLPLGQSVLILLVIIVSFIVTRLLTTYVNSHKPLEEI